WASFRGPCYTRRKVLPMSPNARHPCLRSKHPSQGGEKTRCRRLSPPLRSFEVALLESRPEGAATFQPRAPPWGLERVLRIATPCRGRTGLWSRILFRPFRAGRIL